MRRKQLRLYQLTTPFESDSAGTWEAYPRPQLRRASYGVEWQESSPATCQGVSRKEAMSTPAMWLFLPAMFLATISTQAMYGNSVRLGFRGPEAALGTDGHRYADRAESDQFPDPVRQRTGSGDNAHYASAG